MTLQAADMLRRLGSGVVPGAAERAPAGAPDFAALLRGAREGTAETGAPVRVADDVGIRLSETQLARLASAADRALAEGANRAIVVLDGMALTLDVHQRLVTGIEPLAGDPERARVIAGADAVVVAQADRPSRTAPIGPPKASALFDAFTNPTAIGATRAGTEG